MDAWWIVGLWWVFGAGVVADVIADARRRGILWMLTEAPGWRGAPWWVRVVGLALVALLWPGLYIGLRRER